MIAFLIGLAPYIPIILQVVGWLIKMFGTSEENLRLYAEMVQKNKDAGLITVDAARTLENFHKLMKLEAAARKAKKEQKNADQVRLVS